MNNSDAETHIKSDGTIRMIQSVSSQIPNETVDQRSEGASGYWSSLTPGIRLLHLIFLGPIGLILLLLTPIPGIDEFIGFCFIIVSFVLNLGRFLKSLFNGP
jgi:hypothetical protein